MGCIEKIYSVSALIGTGKCNGKCKFCAATDLRKEVGVVSKDLYFRNFDTALRLSARYGGWSLSLTGSGEPSVEPECVTEALEHYSACAKQGAYFPNVNLFTNGILFGDGEYCNTYLPLWRKLGLTNVAISIHDVEETGQAEAYNIDSYPNLVDIKRNIEKHGVGVRLTLLLHKGIVDSSYTYAVAVSRLLEKGFNNITSWPVGNPDNSRNEFTPSRWGLFSIRRWLRKNAKMCHGHAWGGGVFDYNGAILRYTDYVTKHNRRKDFVRQLVVFQDGTVAYSWIREGALCMK